MNAYPFSACHPCDRSIERPVFLPWTSPSPSFLQCSAAFRSAGSSYFGVWKVSVEQLAQLFRGVAVHALSSLPSLLIHGRELRLVLCAKGFNLLHRATHHLRELFKFGHLINLPFGVPEVSKRNHFHNLATLGGLKLSRLNQTGRITAADCASGEPALRSVAAPISAISLHCVSFHERRINPTVGFVNSQKKVEAALIYTMNLPTSKSPGQSAGK